MAEEAAPAASAPGPTLDKDQGGDGLQPRRKWDNNMEFMFSMVVVLVSPSTFMMFPFLMTIHGGIAFLIPYLLFLFLIALPLLFLEMAVGQFTSEGPVTAWKKICPMFQGVGIASMVSLFPLLTSQSAICVWSMVYFFNSFTNTPAWSHCSNSWNTAMCASVSELMNFTANNDYDYNMPIWNDTYQASEVQFWKHRVLRSSEDFSVGVLHCELVLDSLALWIICYLCTWKGIRFMGKVSYITATVPYALLTLLFFRAVTLPGASEGLRHIFYPSFYRLANSNAWSDAAAMVLHAYAGSRGIVIAMGSYNKYNNNCFRDCFVLCGVHTLTCILLAIMAGAVTGYLSQVSGRDIYDIITTGNGWWFISFPTFLSALPSTGFWAVLYFLAALFLAIGPQIVYMESLATAITDMFPNHLRRRLAREKLVLGLCVACFLLGLVHFTEAGLITVQMLDYFAGHLSSVLVIVGCEIVVIGWVYGADRFLDNIQDMIGFRPVVVKYVWLFIVPLLLFLQLNEHYGFWMDGYQLGVLGQICGALLVVTPLIFIPIFIVVTVCKDIDNMAKPSADLRQAQPHNPLLTMCNSVVFSAPPAKTADGGNEKMMMEETAAV